MGVGEDQEWPKSLKYIESSLSAFVIIYTAARIKE